MTDDAAFVTDVTVPDGTQFNAGDSIGKVWRLRNTGTCTWQNYKLVFVSGAQMGAPAAVAVPETAPGATADISVQMTAPSANGAYTGKWEMQDARGRSFGDNIFVMVSIGMACPRVTGIFANLWSSYKDRLGCSKSDIYTISRVAEQPFQNGHMFWFSDTDETYVLYNTKKWETNSAWKWDGSYPNDIGLSPPVGLYEPKRGFGYIWRNYLGREEGKLGWATDVEHGFDNFDKIQYFDRGIIFRDSDGKTRGLAYVLFNNGLFVREAY